MRAALLRHIGQAFEEHRGRTAAAPQGRWVRITCRPRRSREDARTQARRNRRAENSAVEMRRVCSTQDRRMAAIPAGMFVCSNRWQAGCPAQRSQEHPRRGAPPRMADSTFRRRPASSAQALPAHPHGAIRTEIVAARTSTTRPSPRLVRNSRRPGLSPTARDAK